MEPVTKKILIIEDEKPMARILELKLAHAGFEAKAVFNGKDGIELLQKETYDLVLLDLMMPEMNGFTVLEILKEKKVKTSVMVLSNLGQENDEKRAKELGARAFFVKSSTPMATIVEQAMQFLK